MKLVEHKLIDDFKGSKRIVYLEVKNAGCTLTYLDVVILLYIKKCDVTDAHHDLTTFISSDATASDTIFTLYDPATDDEITDSLTKLLHHSFIRPQGKFYTLTIKSQLIIDRCKLDDYLKYVQV